MSALFWLSILLALVGVAALLIVRADRKGR